MKWIAVGYCHIGKIRQNNEDNLLVDGLLREDINQEIWRIHKQIGDKTALFAVCDGMGGAAHGEWASLEGVKALHSIEDIAEETILQQLQNANQNICVQMKEKNVSQMGTTCVALSLMDTKMQVINIGDSRCYRYRDHVLEQLSEDHTEYERKLRMGISPQKLEADGRAKNTLTQHLGIFPEEMVIEPYVGEMEEAMVDDVYLLCSDGLTGLVKEDTITQILSQDDSLEKRCEFLVESALLAGGTDNVTVVLVQTQ